jgi:sulfur relay (sulfurtransferase) complex TusBCD TusD component (DsrE family)
VKILVIVNESPWGSSLSLTAFRLVRAMASEGTRVAAVYFMNDGVYNAVRGRGADSGTPPLSDAWLDLSEHAEVPLLLCSSAAHRRLPDRIPGFREAGLAEVMELTASCDRVLTF